MDIILIVVQIIASIALIGLILIQQGKGADAGASFGAGASQTFFGSAGSANAVTKLTALFATIFFMASLALAYVAQEEDRTGLQKELSEKLAPIMPAVGDSANSGLAPATQIKSPDSDIAPVKAAPAVISEASETPTDVVEEDQTLKAVDQAQESINMPTDTRVEP